MGGTPPSGRPSRGTIVVPGGDAAFLAPLPVALLPLPAEARERVSRLGAQTLADFGKLPANALRHRFGPDGVTVRALAAGHDEGPLRPRPTPLQLHDTVDLEWVETSLDRLLFLLKRLTDRLSVRLGHHGLGCGRLRVRWLLDDSGLTTGDDPVEAPIPQTPSPTAQGEGEPGAIVSVVRLAEPAGSGSGLLEHLRWHVEGLRPEMFRDPDTGQMRGVRGIVVEAEELAPLGGRQLALLPGEDGASPDSERLLAAERALARLQARWGEGAVRQAELVASRRPERAFRWREAGWAFTLPGTEHGGRAERHASCGRLGRRSAGRPLPPAPRPAQGREAARPRTLVPRPLAASPLWLMGQPEDVEVDRGGRLPNGRRRPGDVTRPGPARAADRPGGRAVAPRRALGRRADRPGRVPRRAGGWRGLLAGPRSAGRAGWALAPVRVVRLMLSASRLTLQPDPSRPAYVELHCHSNFSFLDGTSDPAAARRAGGRARAPGARPDRQSRAVRDRSVRRHREAARRARRADATADLRG